MKFQHVIQAVYFEPWNITRAGWQSVHAIVKPYLDGSREPPQLPKMEGGDPEVDFFGNPLPQLEITPDGIALIPVVGTLLHHASILDKMCGACSYDDIKRDIDLALGSKEVKKIVFTFDTPGGMAVGTEECARKIIEARDSVPCLAVTDCLCASAGYYLASACDEIRCTPTAEVGSIGTLLPIIDETAAWQKIGLEMNLFKSGALKGAGFPGTELDKEQRKYFQGIVDKFAGMFKGHVQAQRPVVLDGAMEGQVFIGEDAKEMGLVDDIVDDIEECYCIEESDLG